MKQLQARYQIDMTSSLSGATVSTYSQTLLIKEKQEGCCYSDEAVKGVLYRHGHPLL